jgi:hypothetical protein
MKKLITLLSIVFFATSLFSQNIENKLGANGNFLIKESGADGKTLFRVKKDIFGNSELVIARDPYVWPPSEDIWMLDVHSSTNLGPNISFASFGNINQGAVLHFQKAFGSGPGTVQAGNILGSIHFTGYKDNTSNFVTSAIIESKVNGMGTNGPSADITFGTSDGTSLLVRMTVKSDGTINIAGLYATTGGGTGDKPVFVSSNGDLVAGTAVSAPNKNTNRIDQLERENQELKRRLEKLEAIVQELTK